MYKMCGRSYSDWVWEKFLEYKYEDWKVVYGIMREEKIKESMRRLYKENMWLKKYLKKSSNKLDRKYRVCLYYIRKYGEV